MAILSRRKFLKGSLGVMALAGFGLGKCYYNTFKSQIRLEKVRIKIPRLPSAFRGTKIAQLSDLHSSSIVSQDHIARAVELVMSEKPDMVVLTGDYIGESLRLHGEVHEFEKVYVDRCADALSGLKAPMGIFAVLGNHDFWSGPDATRAIYEEFERRVGTVWLRNAHVPLQHKGERLDLLGVDDYWESSFSIKKAALGTKGNIPKILLSHNPEVNDILKPDYGIDLVLSGHSHGGQVILPFIGVPFLPGLKSLKYLKGLVRDGARQTYITRGVGHLVAPVRLNCPPEATLITLV